MVEHRVHLDFPFRGTEAADLLAAALASAKAQGTSLRSVGRVLGYKQPVVLSHMASGRVAIPIERAADLARALEIDQREFVLAVLEQRYPGLPWGDLLITPAGRVVRRIEIASGRALDDCNEEQVAVMMEAAAEPRPRRRWLAVPEIEVIAAIRSACPEVQAKGLERADLDGVEALLSHP